MMSIEIEQKVLGCMLASELAIDAALDHDIIPEDFSEPLHRDIFEDLINLPPDQRESVITSMRLNVGHGTVTGGLDIPEYLDKLKSHAGSLMFFSDHVAQLITTSTLRADCNEGLEIQGQ